MPPFDQRREETTENAQQLLATAKRRHAAELREERKYADRLEMWCDDLEACNAELKEELARERAKVESLQSELKARDDQEAERLEVRRALEEPVFSFQTGLEALGWCMLHTADRGMSEQEIMTRLRHFSRLGGAKVEIPTLSHLKSLSPLGLTPWIFRLATAPDKKNNTVALVRRTLIPLV